MHGNSNVKQLQQKC